MMPDFPDTHQSNTPLNHDEVLLAVATKGDGAISQHFGHADAFSVYAAGPAGVRLIGVRTVEHYCQGGSGDEDKRDVILRALADCTALFVARVGDGPRAKLEAAGIEPVDSYPFEPIEASLGAWFGTNRERLSGRLRA
jgi:nitrogen fixation protein NifB